MNARISRISLAVFGVMLLASTMLLSAAGDYWHWYAVMSFFAVPPFILGPHRYRVIGAVAMILSVILIAGDIELGKHFRARNREIYRTR